MTLLYFMNKFLSLGTIIAQLFIVAFLVYFVFFRKKKHPIIGFFGKYGMLLAFLVALTATLGSLFYSEIAGFEPCKLCWFQRIFMYPQVLLLGLALWKHDKNIRDYALWLSGIGALIAGYHYLLQLGLAPSIPCSAIGYSVACSKVFVMNFRYITIPLMALTAFVLIIVFLFFQKMHSKNNSN